MARFLTGRPVTLTHKFVDDLEKTLSPSSVNVTVTSVQTGLVVEAVDDVPVSNGTWSTTLPALPIGAYRVTWDGGTTAVDTDYFEVTGSQIFSIAEARAQSADLADKNMFPPEDIAHYREVVENEFEKITSRSFVPRRRSITLDATGADAIWLGIYDPIQLVSVTDASTGTVLSVSDFRLDQDGILSGLDGVFDAGAPVTVVVDYGFVQCPEDVKRAAITRCRYLLAAEDSGIPDRATMFQAASGGMFYLATPGKAGFYTGIPDVDVVLKAYTYDTIHGVMGVFG